MQENGIGPGRQPFFLNQWFQSIDAGLLGWMSYRVLAWDWFLGGATVAVFTAQPAKPGEGPGDAS